MKYIYLLLLITLTGSLFAYTSSASLEKSIIALDKTRLNIIKELKIQDMTPISKHEKKEYKVFLDYLNTQIELYCFKLYQMIEVETKNRLPCKVNKNNFDLNEFKTNEEQLASMDDMLMSSLNDFDEMLLNENITSSKKNKKTNERENKSELEKYVETNHSLEGNNKSYKNNKNTTMNGESSNSNDTNNSADDSNISGKSGSKSTGAAENNRKNTKILEADDDIVARQLREAAEKEKDPVLKKKLWEEYEKYKQNL